MANRDLGQVKLVLAGAQLRLADVGIRAARALIRAVVGAVSVGVAVFVVGADNRGQVERDTA